ncbi:extracellular solute-binding protein [Wenjunlia tyrosinilytica]|nr:extracellular solute-binding protein [Wenjunlia tyrosinilytica]
MLAIGAALALTATAACGGNGSSNSSGKPEKITIWLQPEAAEWSATVDKVNAEFKTKYGIEAVVQTQQWEDHLTKLDTALAGTKAPDVVELGNTETAKYLAAGAFADLTAHKAEFENSDTWAKGLTDSCTYEGKVSCVPYYGGSRAVIYNKSLFAKAGITDTPTSLDELYAAADKLKAKFGSDPNFSAFYLPGRQIFAGMSFVRDYGGDIARQDKDSWRGTLDAPQAQQGLAAFKELVTKYSKADKTGGDRTQDATFAKGKVGMTYGLSWEIDAIIDPKRAGNPAMKDKIGAFPMPSHTPGQTMPVFLGGSDLAIPAKSRNQEWARKWLALYTATAPQSDLAAKGLIPNSTKLLDKVPDAAAPFAEAARKTWFTPVAENWITVEKKSILQNLQVSILTGKAGLPDATAKASKEITEILNTRG